MKRNILAQAQCAFISVLTRKKPNSADISDDISDVSSKTIIHCRLKGPLTDLFESLLGKIYSNTISSFLVTSELFHVF